MAVTRNRIKILDIGINTGTFQSQLNQIMQLTNSGQSRIVCVANVHMVMEGHRDIKFSELLNQSDWLTPDGMPLVWSMRLQGVTNQERVSGMDLMPAILAEAEKTNLSIYFLGSTNEVLAEIRERIIMEYPQLKIAGMISPPFRPLSNKEDSDIINKINASKADLLLVSLGCPKQERWMHAHRNKVQAVMVGLGGAFPVFAGIEQRAPKWMQHFGLEWVFRLSHDPGRLWQRYIFNNPSFMWNFFLQITGLKKFST